MGKIIVSENVTLDGVVEDPAWFGALTEKDREAWAEVLFAEALSARALLLGRRTYEWFAQRWPSRTGAWADRLNAMPKHVVSTTLEAPAWRNSTVLKGEEIPALKREIDGDVVVYGSDHLVRTLVEHGLVDELRLMICPLVLGTGGRLLQGTSAGGPLRLTGTRTMGDNLVLLTYRTTPG